MPLADYAVLSQTREKSENFFFKVRENSGDFTFSQGNYKFLLKARKKSGNFIISVAKLSLQLELKTM